jgi:hypothetical protein
MKPGMNAIYPREDGRVREGELASMLGGNVVLPWVPAVVPRVDAREPRDERDAPDEGLGCSLAYEPCSRGRTSR